jgi:hypothetical protein
MMLIKRKASVKKLPSKRVALTNKSTQITEKNHLLLIAYLLYLRKLKTIYNKMDSLNQNAKLLSQYNYQCEHNLLFFLTVTAQFNKLHILFKNKPKKPKLRAIKRMLKKRRSKIQIKKNRLNSIIFSKNLNSLPNSYEKTHSNNRYQFFTCMEHRAIENETFTPMASKGVANG